MHHILLMGGGHITAPSPFTEDDALWGNSNNSYMNGWKCGKKGGKAAQLFSVAVATVNLNSTIRQAFRPTSDSYEGDTAGNIFTRKICLWVMENMPLPHITNVFCTLSLKQKRKSSLNGV